jgi:broad specificity phosphatase PhoE
MPIVWLIRHAESEANAGLPTSGPADIPLTRRGVRQAKYVADRLEEAPALIVASPYLRTQQTAQPTIERFPTVESQVWPVQEFTYISPDRCYNTTVKDRRPMVEAYWDRADPAYVDGEGAESFCALIDRVGNLAGRLRAYGDELIVIFTHGQFIRALVWTLLTGSTAHAAESMRQFRPFAAAFPVPNASIMRLQVGETIWLSPVDASHIPAAIRS